MGNDNRIWIELQEANSEAHAKEVCAQANVLLKRLGVTGKFGWYENHGCYTFGDHGGYLELSDRGHWFNLTYLAGAK